MGWIIGGIVMAVVVALYCCFVAAGRADQRAERYYNEYFKNK